MKIAVCGRGGTGKSTVVALLAHNFKRIGMRVIVIDSDESNSGLHWMLGLDKQANPLMDFAGGKKDVQGKMLARFGSGQSEPEMSILRRDDIHMEDIPADYMAEGDGKRLITIGKIKQSLEGCACTMGVLSREFLGKLHALPGGSGGTDNLPVFLRLSLIQPFSCFISDQFNKNPGK